jgi:hypothetical protein
VDVDVMICQSTVHSCMCCLPSIFVFVTQHMPWTLHDRVTRDLTPKESGWDGRQLCL